MDNEFLIEAVRLRIAEAVETHIHPMFSDSVKLTVIARLPSNNEAEFVITEDELPEVAKLLERQIARDNG